MSMYIVYDWVLAPRYLSDRFTTRIVVMGHVTRSCQLSNIPLYKSNAGQETFYYYIVHKTLEQSRQNS